MYTPITKRVSFPLRGPTSSRKLNDFTDQVTTDLVALAKELGIVENDTSENFKTMLDEMRYLSRRVSQMEGDREHQRSVDSRNGLRTTFHQSMYDVKGLSFFANDNSLRPVVTPAFGVAHLPVNAVESKFFSNSIYNGDIITPGSLSVEVVGTFTPEGESTAVNYEAGAMKVVEGDAKNAFNGNNRSYWVREVHFDDSSDVTEVQCELIVTLPSQNNTMSNVLTLHPYPQGSVDVMGIHTSPDLTQSWTALQHVDAPSVSAPMNNARDTKFLFPPQDIDQVRVRLRSRNFVEEDGKKIFRLGLQELGLFLVDFEKSSASLEFSNWSSQGDAQNISMVHKIVAPSGMAFRALHDFRSTPDITLESDGNRHVIFRIYDGDPVTGAGTELWNSNQTFPQDQPDGVGAQITFGGSVTTMYVVTSMRFVETSGGVSSPFPANTSPYVDSFSLEVSATPAL